VPLFSQTDVLKRGTVKNINLSDFGCTSDQIDASYCDV
jgi:hypothetical protein